MTVSFHPAARAELNAAIDYYEDCQSGVGYAFAEEVYAAIARVLQYPEGRTPLSPKTRRCLTTRFPYGIIYQVREGHIRILAIAHCHRHPGYWRGRIADQGGTEQPPGT